MKVSLVSHEDNKAIFEVEVAYEEFKKEVQKAYLQNRKRFNIPGFRKGKAPRQIIEMNYGKEVFWSDALDMIMNVKYFEAIKELEIEPIDRPSVDVKEIEEGNPIVLEYEVVTKPVAVLGDYSVIEIEKPREEVTDEEVDAFIEGERDKNKIIKNIDDRAVEDGDICNINFEGFKGEEAFEGGKGENYDLTIGSDTFIPGFEEQLIGKNKGEEFDVNLTFPEDYHAEDLKGEEVVFKVKINDIKEEILPELDDEFVKDVSEFDTLDEYKNDVRAKLQEQLEEENKMAIENAAVEKLIEMTEVEVPEVMVEEQIDREMQEYEHNLSHMGLSLDQFLQYTGNTRDGLREEFKEQAALKVKGDLALEALALAEGFEASEEDIENEYNIVAEQYGQKDSEEFIAQVKASIGADFMTEIVKKRKGVEFLTSKVKFIEAE